jgi:hypothetical protein
MPYITARLEKQQNLPQNLLRIDVAFLAKLVQYHASANSRLRIVRYPAAIQNGFRMR